MNTDFSTTATTVEEVAVGAAQTAAEVASDPIRAARKQARSLGRKGTPAVRRINRRLIALIPDKVQVFGMDVNEKFPQKLARKGLHLVKAQAKREDMVGDVAKRTLGIVSGSAKSIAKAATSLQQATDLTPRRETERKPPRRRAARSRAA